MSCLFFLLVELLLFIILDLLLKMNGLLLLLKEMFIFYYGVFLVNRRKIIREMVISIFSMLKNMYLFVLVF